jgi:predicted nucleotidyltransferase
MMTEHERDPERDFLHREPALAEGVRQLVEAYKPIRIYLFGPKARGDAEPDSDYDVLLVVPDGTPPERRDSKLAHQVL